MPNLKKLLAIAFEIYIKYEDSRYLSSIPNVRSVKAPKLLRILIAHTEENINEQEKAIALDIIALLDDTEVKNSNKLRHIIAILATCANVTLTKISPEKALTNLTESTTTYETALSDLTDKNALLYCAEAFLLGKILVEKERKILIKQQEISLLSSENDADATREAHNAAIRKELQSTQDRLKNANKTNTDLQAKLKKAEADLTAEKNARSHHGLFKKAPQKQSQPTNTTRQDNHINPGKQYNNQ